jgi:hypothetical protein
MKHDVTLQHDIYVVDTKHFMDILDILLLSFEIQ